MNKLDISSALCHRKASPNPHHYTPLEILSIPNHNPTPSLLFLHPLTDHASNIPTHQYLIPTPNSPPRIKTRKQNHYSPRISQIHITTDVNFRRLHGCAHVTSTYVTEQRSRTCRHTSTEEKKPRRPEYCSIKLKFCVTSREIMPQKSLRAWQIG